ncbi:MAG: hypothetical protein ABS36_18200 [Acidobacteria bacterium SCN 69-37]|nr:MAG: hypothetical protein ABS36_18200 [Acidobacteria bacterium SCN 69-37]
MTPASLRIVVADDEGPARRFLIDLLGQCDGVTVVGEAGNGDDALALIGNARPDLALLDLQMPGATGLEVARQIPPETMPSIAFVTAYDEYAIDAFELNAIDYLLKPVQIERLRTTIDRARARRRTPAADQVAALARVAAAVDGSRANRVYLDRLPIRRQDDTVLVPVRLIASVSADGELLHVTTTTGERHTLTHRLHALESRLDPRRFVRLSRGTLVNIDLITRVSPMPGGTALVKLTTGQELPVSRIQFRLLRETLLRL